MHTHKQAAQCQERQRVRTKRGFGETGADNHSGLVYHGSSLTRSQLYDWQTAPLLCFMGDKWVRYRETRKPTTQSDEKLKDCKTCAVANTCRDVLLSVCGVVKRTASVWSVWLQWININWLWVKDLTVNQEVRKKKTKQDSFSLIKKMQCFLAWKINYIPWSSVINTE